MDMSQHKDGSLGAKVYAILEQQILDGVRPAGEVLTENALSAQLGVSRTPVREALRRLEQESLVQDSPKGLVVVGLSRKDLSDIYEIRVRIEGLAARWAAEYITAEQIARLREIVDLQEFYTLKERTDRVQDMDSEFHSTVYSSCASKPVKDTLGMFHHKIQQYRKASMENSSRATQVVAEHRAIIAALDQHDPDLAEELAVKHITNARASVLHASFQEEQSN